MGMGVDVALEKDEIESVEKGSWLVVNLCWDRKWVELLYS